MFGCTVPLFTAGALAPAPPAGRPTRALLLLGLALALGGCESAPVKACRAQMQSSQEALLVMDNRDEKSVRAALGAVEGALSACEKAGLGTEAKDVRSAKRTLEGHLEQLAARAAKPQKPTRSPEQLAKLLADGDPTCPRGQGYAVEPSKKVVRCTGKVLVEQDRGAARGELERMGLTLRPAGELELLGEFGAERIRLSYAAKDAPAPLCVEVTAAPGASWQEVVARLTSTPPAKLALDRPVVVGGRSLALRVEGQERQRTVFLGDCPASTGSSAPAQPAAGAPEAQPGGATVAPAAAPAAPSEAAAPAPAAPSAPAP
jgi:hypothetical protein